ncbi:uncharacterized protein CEXT_302961 [Caerostris extrusa]|uniref:Uncharacterized protein n=1 Tax=Caerostris extrusa TaxID=172846 RepID=A0AAV4RLE2_CAEEX|nr:uncharacterized protein CEXT_302961 [Caerostris extrusa]
MTSVGNWPGFNFTPVTESFWDSNYNPSVGSWTDKAEECEVLNSSPNNIWNDALTPIWETSLDTWSTPNCDKSNSITESVLDENILINSEKINDENKECAVGKFNPFHTPSAQWISELKETKEVFNGSSESNTWSFSLFSDPSQILHTEELQDSGENDGKDIIATENSI